MRDPSRWLKPLLLGLGLLPLLWLAWRGVGGGLGVNPVETLNRTLGDWTLRLLLLTLTITPLRRLTGWGWLLKLRRMVGLYAFFYATLHLCSYIIIDQFFDWAEIGADIIKRPYITVGLSAFLLLIPLAVTSTKAMRRRLGRNWQRLQRLVYPIAIAGVVHYYMLVKADTREPLLYALLLGILLAARLIVWAGPHHHRRRAATDPTQ